MATTIITKNGSGAPLAGDLTAGELAVDLTNKRLYSKDSGGTVIELGTNAGSSTFEDLTVTGDLTVDTNTLYVDSTNNRVGIGTTTTSEALTVAGSGTTARISLTDTDSVRASMTGLMEFDGTDDRAGFIGYDAGDMSLYAAVGDIKLSTGGAARLTIDETTGNVGIGASTIDTALHIERPNPVIQLEDSTNGFIAQIDGENGALAFKADIAGASGSATNITFDIDGSERMRIDSNGNVGIGTPPSSNLHVYNGTDAEEQVIIAEVSGGFSNGAGISLRRDGTEMGRIKADYFDGMTFHATTGSGGAATERMRIDGSGNVHVGTAAGDVGNVNIPFAVMAKGNSTSAYNDMRGIHVNNENATAGAGLFGSGISFGRNESNSDDASAAILPVQTTTDPDRVGLAFFVHPTNTRTNPLREAARFEDSGNLLVGNSTASSVSDAGMKYLDTGSGVGNQPRLSMVGASSINSEVPLSVYSTTASAYRFYVTYGGNIYAANTSINAISDATLKENVRDLDKGLDTILALQPRRFDWINGDGDDIMGFVAQEVEEVMPELVHDFEYSEGVTKKALKMGDMLPSMVKAIQEQQAMIEELKAEVAALKGA